MSDEQKKTDRPIGRKILVFGSTGTTGREVVKQALEQGYAVTAFVRDAAKVGLEHAGLTVVEGDVMDPGSVARAMPGHDAVLCSLGAGRKGTVRSRGTQHILAAMDQAGIRRFVCQSTLGVGESQGNLNFYWKHVMFGMLLRDAFADHVHQESVIRKSDLDWTIVRPGALVAGSRTGRYQHGFSGAQKGLARKISTADVADFMLRQLDDDTYLHAAPGLSY